MTFLSCVVTASSPGFPFREAHRRGAGSAGAAEVRGVGFAVFRLPFLRSSFRTSSQPDSLGVSRHGLFSTQRSSQYGPNLETHGSASASRREACRLLVPLSSGSPHGSRVVPCCPWKVSASLSWGSTTDYFPGCPGAATYLNQAFLKFAYLQQKSLLSLLAYGSTFIVCRGTGDVCASGTLTGRFP